ncbi:coiled-coil domain-containing protein 42-like [Engraulis encrasicolus]|uniref:coiled-coil domain-containing protein 42-like n=1 Tax=Engraulis encrasicolus TaxID=184585 RepID=UPI002FD304D6
MKERELEVLSGELRVLSAERDRLAAEVDRNQLYPEYLIQVVKLCKQFDEPRQVMSRFATLVTTREDLLAGAKEGEESVNRALAQQAAFIEHSNDQIIHYSNQLAQLQTQLDSITSQAMMWESRWVHIQNTAAKKTLLLGTIKMATLNLYTSMCGKDKPTQKGYTVEDTLEQLGKIQCLMTNLNGIMDEVRKFELKEQR